MMRVINIKDYNNEGVFINLDMSFKPYDNLLNNHYKYLSKDKECNLENIKICDSTCFKLIDI